MAIFATTEDLYAALLPFYEDLVADPKVGPMFAGANTSFRIRHNDPDAVFVLDATGGKLTLLHGADAEDVDTEVELLMSGDDGHKFWLGKLNLPMAMARKKIKVDGGVTKLLGIVPALQPAHAMYQAYAEKTNLPLG